jgi:hypothetical protein
MTQFHFAYGLATDLLFPVSPTDGNTSSKTWQYIHTVVADGDSISPIVGCEYGYVCEESRLSWSVGYDS